MGLARMTMRRVRKLLAWAFALAVLVVLGLGVLYLGQIALAV